MDTKNMVDGGEAFTFFPPPQKDFPDFQGLDYIPKGEGGPGKICEECLNSSYLRAVPECTTVSTASRDQG